MKSKFGGLSVGAAMIRTPVGRFDIAIIEGDVRIFGWEALHIIRGKPRKVSPDAKRFVEEMKEYFRCGAWDFSWFKLPGRPDRVSQKALLAYEYLRKHVGPGTIISYRDLGLAVGIHPRGIGSMMRSNPWPIVVPCHRIIGSDGSLGGYAGGPEKKEWLLKLEKWPGSRK